MSELIHKLAFFYCKSNLTRGYYARPKRTARTLCQDYLGDVQSLIGEERPYDTDLQAQPKSLEWHNVNCAECLALRDKEDEVTNIKYKEPLPRT